jgi:hypothetical protein
VRNIKGITEIANPLDDITLQNIHGSALLNSTDGNLSADFISVDEKRPMAFATLEGKIILVLPQMVNTTLNMKTSLGKIYNGFDAQTDSQKTYISSKESLTGKRYKINSGGGEIKVQTFGGDIFIKKRIQ